MIKYRYCSTNSSIIGILLSFLKSVNIIYFCIGSENHYNFFESLICGRNLETDFQAVGERFKRIFPAQVLKGNIMILTLK